MNTQHHETPYYLPIGDEADIFRAAYECRLPVLLKGPTGCGKTRFVEYMAYSLMKEEKEGAPDNLITVACHEDLTGSDLVGRYLIKGDETVWIDGVKPNLARLADAFDPIAMDALLLLAPTVGSIGYAGRGDFAMAADGRLRKRAAEETAPFVYAGAAILLPALFKGAPQGEFPLTALFDRAAAAGRLHGLRLEGLWMHVGTPAVIAEAEARRRHS